MLKKLSQVYEIMIFTAAVPEYAHQMRKLIDPNNEYISHIFDRSDCIKTNNGLFIKDLRIIQRDLSNVLIVDDLVHSFGLQIDNGIPILQFTGNKKDEELLYLTIYLLKLEKLGSMVEFNKRNFRLRELLTTLSEQ